MLLTLSSRLGYWLSGRLGIKKRIMLLTLSSRLGYWLSGRLGIKKRIIKGC